MVNGGAGMSGHTFDAFVSSQRNYNEPDWAAKIQEKYWRARQKFLAKIERKEDSCIVLSDSKLDSKLEIYRSIDQSCKRLTDILESYQDCLFVFANEENALGILLKECGKHDKTKAGKIMSLTGKSLTQSSHQRIRLYMPLLRLFQEMETFHSRAVEDTSNTVDKLEERRSQYRASLLWMKDISEKLDPDVYRQLDKFRRVQNKVRDDKRAFDSMQMDVVQKIDLLMASRCNSMNQTLASYQTILLETFEKNHNNFKSVEEIISAEDLYEYEFKTLKQLNPLKISDEPSSAAKKEPSQAIESTESEQGDSNLIGNIEPSESSADSNNNPTSNQNLISGTGQLTSASLIDMNTPEITQLTRSRSTSLIALNEQEEDELAQSLDLLDTLFGSSSDTGAPNESRKSKRHEGEVKEFRANINANLLDVDGEDEAKQVASLLGLSERASSSRAKHKDDENPLGLMNDIFSKWAEEKDNTTKDKNIDSLRGQGGSMTSNSLDQDLMGIGGSTMPKATSDKSLADFLA